jgi:hypothetical protein
MSALRLPPMTDWVHDASQVSRQPTEQEVEQIGLRILPATRGPFTSLIPGCDCIATTSPALILRFYFY